MNAKKEKAIIGLRKARSLINTLLTMVETDAYCIDIMQQNLAVIGLLKAAHQSLLEGHLNSCVSGAMATGSATKKGKLIDEIVRVTKLSSK